LHDGGGAALTSGASVLTAKSNGNNDDDEGDDDGDDGHGNGMAEISADLDSTGVIEGAEGEAAFRAKNDSTEFEVEIEDVPAGLYALVVGGVERGQIEVVADGDDFKGRIRFSDPQKDDRELLDFAPAGQWIEVLSGTDVILEVLFPEA
jgi:hypothetical protein